MSREGIDPPHIASPQMLTLNEEVRSHLIDRLYGRCQSEIDLGIVISIWRNAIGKDLDVLENKYREAHGYDEDAKVRDMRKDLWKNYLRRMILSEEPSKIYQLIECVAQKTKAEQNVVDSQNSLPLEEQSDYKKPWLEFRLEVNEVLDHYWCAYRINLITGDVLPATSVYEETVIEMAFVELEEENYDSSLSHLLKAKDELIRLENTSGHTAAKESIDALESLIIALAIERLHLRPTTQFAEALSRLSLSTISEPLRFVINHMYSFRNNTVGHGMPHVSRENISIYEGRKIFVICCALIDTIIFRKKNGTLRSLSPLTVDQKEALQNKIEAKLEKEKLSLFKRYGL